nr:ATP synthase subunit 6 [Cylindrotaenia sp. MN-2022]
MFNVINGYSTILVFVYNYLIKVFSYYYLLVMTVVLLMLLSYRIPYCYSPYLFIVLLVVIVFSSFISLFSSRVANDYLGFFGSFVPVGTPLYICCLVCLAETISYIIRPIVLILRPFINVSLGCLGAVAISNLCLVSYMWCAVLVILFFYEVFVAVVHWYIVTSILAFSIDH